MKTEIVQFKPSSIELVITGAIDKNTLPDVRDSLTKWLDQFNAADLSSDVDFAQADRFVKECSAAETQIAEIKETALSGDIQAALKDLDAMQEAIRQKRLEFSRALKTRKDTRKDELIKKAAAKVEQGLAALARHSRPDIMSQLLAAVKGKSSFGNMEDALEAEAESIIEAEQVYCNRFDELKAQTAKVFSAAGEVVSEIELNDLVKNHFENAPERAGVIIESKRNARERAELEAQKKQAPAPVAQPKPEPVAAQPEKVAPRAEAKLVRFGVTFLTSDIEATSAALTALGGRDIRTAEVKK